MSQTKSLDLKSLQQAVTGGAAAFRRRTRLEPAGGEGDKVFPPTYEGGKYATEKRVIGGQRVDCVVLDSVASQANRIELALLDAVRAGRFGDAGFPLISVDFSKQKDVADVGAISSLEAPHRIADAILRDSELEGAPFRDTAIGKSFTDASLRDATSLFTYCPTALVFGLWDSTGPKGGLGAKFARVLVSEIVGVDVEGGKKTSSRIDPLQIPVAAGPLFEGKKGGWTLDEAQARVEKGKPVKLGKDGKPSEANHGNIPPTIDDAGGVTLHYALQVTTLSLPGLRRLHFPMDGKTDTKRDEAARTVLAALSLCGATLSSEKGLDLRSRCLLVPSEAVEWEVVGDASGTPARYRLDAQTALALLQEAVKAAEAAGLTWHKAPITLTPKADFVKLVHNARVIAAKAGAEEA